MLITIAHLIALYELAAGEASGHAVSAPIEDEPRKHIYRGLELQGFALFEAPGSYRLTYAGHEAFLMLEAMRAAALLPPLDTLKDNWRFLGSDILTALQAAQRNGGRVGPLTLQALNARGLTENVHDTLDKRSFIRLNGYGRAWLDFARRYRPRLEITRELANSIYSMQAGYTGRSVLHMPAEHIDLLEAMDLITWSVPEGTVYALTALGQAVYEALHKGRYAPDDMLGYATYDAVLDEPILGALAVLRDQGSTALTSEQLLNLQTLGYVEFDGTLSGAGQAAMRVYALFQHESLEYIRTFAITEPEVELLTAVQHLTESANGSQMHPDKKTIRRVLVDQMVKRYQAFAGRYGRIMKERSAIKRQAVAMLEHVKEHDEWFNAFWDLEELLLGLEAFDLLHAETDGDKTVYRLTPSGRKIMADQEGKSRDITATAVKALTTVATRFHAPADPWVEEAREEELIAVGVTRSGRLYAELAECSVRKPALTRDEAEVLVNLPEAVRDLRAPAALGYASIVEERQGWAFEKLEARGLIERLVDGQIVRTEAGQFLHKAVSGAMHLGMPVTPTIVRVLEAIRQVGTLYDTERKVRIMPHHWAEAERLSGLGQQEFQEIVHIARMGHYIGEVSITEAGLNLLAAQDQLKKQAGLS
jgi:uncharacterized protein